MNSIQAELTDSQLAELRESPLFNADLAPVPASARKWRVGSFAALWISMSACIPTYMLASSLVGNKFGAAYLLSVFLGHQPAGDLQRHRLHPLAAEHQSAVADRTGPAARVLGVSAGAWVRADAVEAIGIRSRPATGWQVFQIL